MHAQSGGLASKRTTAELVAAAAPDMHPHKEEDRLPRAGLL